MRTGSNRRPFGRRGTVAGVTGAAINAGVYLIGRAADVTFLVPNFEGGPPARLPLGQVVFVSLVTVLVGTGLAALAGRRGKLADIRWIGVAFTLVSLGAPLSLDAATSTRLLLATMHVVAGAAFFIGLRRPAADDERVTPARSSAVTAAIKIVGFGGSLNARSASLAALDASLEAAADLGMLTQRFSVRELELPLYDPTSHQTQLGSSRMRSPRPTRSFGAHRCITGPSAGASRMPSTGCSSSSTVTRRFSRTSRSG